MKQCKICGKELLTGFIVHSDCLDKVCAVHGTKNYLDHGKAISELSIVSIIHIVDYVELLSQFINDENEVLDDMETILKPFNTVIEKLLTDQLCRHSDCDRHLYKSDLLQYDYVCPDCEENF